MVREIKSKSSFQLTRQAAREIGHRTILSYLLLITLIAVVAITFILTQTRKTIIQSASYDETTRTFVETFDGDPANPQNFTQLGQNNWDVQVHTRDRDTWETLETVMAQHGHDCSAPPASHENNTYEGSVFNCRNHIMTSINSGSYGVIYLTPNHMVDFSNGNAIIKFDLSTEKMSTRDWWDISVSPFEDTQALPLLSDLSQGVDLQNPNKNSVVITTDNGEGGPNLKVIRNGVREDYDGIRGYNIPANEGITAGTNQAATRQPFQLTISKTHVKFERLASATGTAIVFVDTDIPALAWSQGVVQLGHHSYNPFKDNAGVAATWHWDTVSLSPATPFTIIKADKRFTEGGIINFNSPAPANAYLRFSGVCAVKVDGVTAQKQTDSGHPEHASSYFVPLAQGKQSVNISFADDGWYGTGFGCIAKDFAIWSKNLSGSSNSLPTPTLIQPTNTPIPTTTQLTPTPTNIPSPTPTRIPTPTPTRLPTPTNIIQPTSTPFPTPTPPARNGTGLQGNYFNNRDFTNLMLTRTDARIDFNWGYNAPTTSMGSDTFSVIWTGYIVAPVSGTYTFYTQTDDGVRLWINSQQLINDWKDHANSERSAKVTLSAGQKVPVRMDYYENRGRANARLLWAYPGITKQVIPQTSLYIE